MELRIAIEKKGVYLDKFIETISKKSEITDKEIREIVGKSNFYEYLLDKISDINNLLSKYINPNIYFCKPEYIKVSNRRLLGLKKHPLIEIEVFDGFYILKHNDNGKQEVYNRLPEWCKIILSMSTKKKNI